MLPLVRNVRYGLRHALELDCCRLHRCAGKVKQWLYFGNRLGMRDGEQHKGRIQTRLASRHSLVLRHFSAQGREQRWFKWDTCFHFVPQRPHKTKKSSWCFAERCTALLFWTHRILWLNQRRRAAGVLVHFVSWQCYQIHRDTRRKWLKCQQKFALMAARW